MATSCTKDRVVHGHPCFGGNRHKNGRIHLAVAPRCNIKCGYCDRRHDCANESRPGVTSRLLTPSEALEQVRGVMASPSFGSIIKVIGIAGPGDPLANDETFETFRLVQQEFPDLLFCLSTNGLALPDRIEELSRINLHSLTVTINAVDPEVAAKIYRQVRYRGSVLNGVEGAEILIRNQFEGVRLAAEHGMVVKVNTVLIPGINEDQIQRIAQRVSEAGAFVMNVMPIIPQADLAHVPRPTPEHLEQVRSANESIIAQFRGCQQCRADAVGLIGGGCAS
ncbi:radical SAM protein [Geomonas subterranea]|uniref:FeMo cofactor biosynthesis protein NifB n=1 Tax=Geomonas subterranea TaxID=2847989 RepID=A0ABX8LPE0_9BACT|nr:MULTISPECIES: radical SAM protein [Geomonas]QXE91395.1 radical SAM protein [Geomonas subterranea]QXM10518.1 radical SAM protein [Geomonas subterranea]